MTANKKSDGLGNLPNVNTPKVEKMTVIKGENPNGLSVRELAKGAWDKDAKRPKIKRS